MNDRTASSRGCMYSVYVCIQKEKEVGGEEGRKEGQKKKKNRKRRKNFNKNEHEQVP